MHVTKLQSVFLGHFKRVKLSGNINATYFNVLPNTLSLTTRNNYSTSFCTNIIQDLTFLNQRLVSLNNVISRQYSSRLRNNFYYMSHPQIISPIISSRSDKREKYKGCKTYYSSQYYNGIRYFSSANIDSVTENQIPQFNFIFKMLSESTIVKIAQDSLLWMHDYTGLPWWSVIVLTTIMMRTMITLPLSLYQVYL